MIYLFFKGNGWETKLLSGSFCRRNYIKGTLGKVCLNYKSSNLINMFYFIQSEPVASDMFVVFLG